MRNLKELNERLQESEKLGEVVKRRGNQYIKEDHLKDVLVRTNHFYQSEKCGIDIPIRSSADIYELFHPLLCDLATEEFWVLLMNHAAKVIDKVRISRGGIDQTTADVRSILREALLQRATQIALIHNHPSGNPHPSNDDRQLTELVRKAAQTMNIHLTDHVIVTDGSHYSFNDEGLL